MTDNNFYSGLWTLGLFFLFSTIFLGITAMIFVAVNDYAYVTFYEIVDEQFVQKGLAPASVLTYFETIATTLLGVVAFLDKMWGVAFVIFVIEFFKNSYMSKREGYLSIFGFISFGMMGMLFLLNLIVTYNNTIYDLFFNKLLANLTLELVLFNLYFNNFQIVNLFLIAAGIILNFLPFDINIFNARKIADQRQNDEVL